MKKLILYSFSALVLIVCSCSFTSNNDSQEKLLIDLISYLIKQVHYGSREFNDAISEEAFDTYIETLDPAKRFFLQSDIDKLSTYKYQMDDYMNGKPMDLFNQSYTLLKTRMKEAESLIDEVMGTPYDFTKKDSVVVDPDDLNYVKNRPEMKERWRLQLKSSTLSNLYSKLEDEKKKKQEDDTYTQESLEALEKKARELTEESIKETFEFLENISKEHYFSLYLNSILETLDPHTSYFSPVEKSNFDDSMSGQFEGIGAELRKKNDGLLISRIIYGGPLWRQKVLEVGDIIQKVAQEKDTQATDIIPMTSDDAIKLIKGPKGTTVRLTIKRMDGAIEEVSIVRDIVELEETYLKTAVVEIDSKKLAIINLPKFYVDFEDYKTSRNAASDMKKEIEHIKKNNVDGILIDLRSNGGGSLKTVVEIGGMFIPSGPIVQVNSSGGKSEVLSDEDPKTDWEKPLVILVDKLSASASEILAAAMQDYDRAIIVGSEQTFGKGTVQNLIDLNSLIRNQETNQQLGALKLTMQKFYRINGGSTQIEGVKSNVILADKYSFIEIGERKMENALAWDEISATNYQKQSNPNFNKAIENSKKRTSQNLFFELIKETAYEIKKEQDIKKRSLNLDDFTHEIESDKVFSKKFDTLKTYSNHLDFKPLNEEKLLFEKDSSLQNKREYWYKNLQKDLYVEESLRILNDLVAPKNLSEKKLAKTSKEKH